MLRRKMITIDRMFEDAIHRCSHENVTGVTISRDMASYNVEIELTIENTERTIMVKDVKCIRNENIRYCRPEHLTFQANKYAHLIDEVPDYISNEQIVMWLKRRMEKL